MSVRLFVGNLTYDVTEADLKELFSSVAIPGQIRLPTDRETGKPRGFAFVDFSDGSQAQEVIQKFNQHMFKGRALVINEARAAGSGPAPRPGSGPRPAPRPSFTGLGDAPPQDDGPHPGQPRRTFGPDAPSRGKRKNKIRPGKEPRGPKGPMREQGGGQLFYGADEDDDDQGLDDFARWAQEDANKKDEE